MITKQDILKALDDSTVLTYNTFIWLGDVYSYLIDSRINVFRGNANEWAIAAERLGYNPRYGNIVLEISYYGNCLNNLEKYNGQTSNYYQVFPITHEDFLAASDDTEGVSQETTSIKVRNTEISISLNKADYEKENIELMELEPNQITWDEATRLFVPQNSDVFRATHEELYKSIPKTLNKLLILDEWYHQDYIPLIDPNLNKPSTIETWELITDVILSNDTSCYKPSNKPNSHWRNWLDSGSL